MKIDSCLIIKNEEDNIETLLNQLFIFSNEVHITDTGSTDNTLNILEKLQKSHNNLFVHHYEWDMNFSNARNYSLTCYECNAAYQFWCDADDLLNDKLIETLKEFSTNKSYNDDIYYIKYKYTETDQNPHVRTSILKKSANLKWHDPIHEYIDLFPNIKLNFKVFDNGSLLLHQRKFTNNDLTYRNRNLEIFFNMEKNKTPFTSRNLYYYGVELMNHGLLDLAYAQFHKCIDDFDDAYHGVLSLREILLHSDPKSLEYSFKLLKKCVWRKDLYTYLGNYYYFTLNNQQLAKSFYIASLHYPEPEDILRFQYHQECVVDSLLQLGLIEYNLGNYQGAIDYNQQILEIVPDHSVAISNLDILRGLNV